MNWGCTPKYSSTGVYEFGVNVRELKAHQKSRGFLCILFDHRSFLKNRSLFPRVLGVLFRKKDACKEWGRYP